MKKQIKEYSNYIISDDGQIIKCSKMARRGNKFMLPVQTSNGYLRVSLMNEGISKSFMVHRLVAEHFVKGKTESNRFVNHKDGDKLNCNYRNLEWVSHSQNMKHAYAIGLLKNRRQFTDKQIIEIRKSPFSLRKLGEIYGISNTGILKIKNYKIYA